MKRRVFLLSYSNNSNSFEDLLHKEIDILLSGFSSEKTILLNKQKDLENQSDFHNFFKNEKEKVEKSDYFIVLFPYLLTGTPSLIHFWMENVFKSFVFNHPPSKEPSQKQKKALIICYTDFPIEIFQPNSFMKGTLKRRLHSLICLLKSFFYTIEPIFFYSIKSIQSIPSNSKSNSNSNDSEKEMHKEAKRVIDDISQSSKGNCCVRNSGSVNGNGNKVYMDEVCNRLVSYLNTIDECSEIDVVDI